VLPDGLHALHLEGRELHSGPRYARAVRRIGHRGAMGHAPENTRESFEKAIALGCDEVETDVWLFGRRLAIAHDRENAAAAPLLLDDVLAICRGRVTVNVELKCAGREPAARDTGQV